MTIWQAAMIVMLTPMPPLEKPISSQTGLINSPAQLLTMPMVQNITKKLAATMTHP